MQTALLDTITNRHIRECSGQGVSSTSGPSREHPRAFAGPAPHGQLAEGEAPVRGGAPGRELGRQGARPRRP